MLLDFFEYKIFYQKSVFIGFFLFFQIWIGSVFYQKVGFLINLVIFWKEFLFKKNGVFKGVSRGI